MATSTLLDELRRRFAAAVSQVAGREVSPGETLLRATSDPAHGDYQCNAAMPLGKPLKRKPREIAEAIVAAVRLDDLCGPLEIAGPGFINIRLRDEALAGRLGDIPGPRDGTPDRVGVPLLTATDHLITTHQGRPLPKVILDYSSPNIAKQMHVGHLRSTIIGDVFARVLSFLGYPVVRQNHVGDWGTAMGMAILGLWYLKTRRRRGEDAQAIRDRLAAVQDAKGKTVSVRQELLAPIAAEWSEDLANPIPPGLDIPVQDLELGYQFIQAVTAVSAGVDCPVRDPDGRSDQLSEIARIVTTHLQAGGEANAYERQEWREACEISLGYCQRIYERLGVLLNRDDVCGESFFDPRLAPVLAELREKLPAEPVAGRACTVLREDDGAQCLYFYQADGTPQFRNPDGDPLPMIVRKSDGAFLYATTDLAAIRYRIEDLGGRRLIYVTDARQKLHFEMFFQAARNIGWACDDVTLEHTTFGSVLGEDRKPLKTRSGDNVKLSELLDEAERRALEVVVQKQAERDRTLTAAQQQEIARRVGIAAVKYADLSRDRNGDYVFSWDQMLALQGNTAPYMLYGYARIRSIYRKAAEQFGAPDVYAGAVQLQLGTPEERALGLHLLRFPEAVTQLAGDLLPHTLCAYLYDLAAAFMRFYEACPVLKSETEPLRLSRMRLCDLTARTLKTGLGLLGIEVSEKM